MAESEEISTVEEKSLKKKYVKQAVNGVFALFDNDPKAKKTLVLGADSVKISVTVVFKKIPLLDKPKTYTLNLDHAPVTGETSICLIVPNVLDPPETTNEETVRHFRELLREKNVACVSEVMASKQFLGDYKTFAARRQVSASHDLFLVDARLTRIAQSMLGKEFYRRRKLPRFVDLKAENLSDEFERVLKQTCLHIPALAHENYYEVGHMGQDPRQVADNVLASVEALREVLPGKWNNVRALMLAYDGGKRVPFYYSGGSTRDVVVAEKAKAKRKYVEDELSTLPNHRVRVYEDGTIRVVKIGAPEGEDDDDLMDEEEEGEDDSAAEEGAENKEDGDSGLDGTESEEEEGPGDDSEDELDESRDDEIIVSEKLLPKKIKNSDANKKRISETKDDEEPRRSSKKVKT